MSSKARGLADLGNAFDDGALSNRNLIINGAMQVTQRGTSVTGVTTGGYRTCDRFSFDINNGGTYTVTQASDGPSDFVKSLKSECTTVSTSTADWSLVNIQHRLEGQNIAHLAYGTADAKTTTISFWVKSNKTGVYTVELNSNTTSRHIGQTITITSSATWEKKTLTFVGDVSNGIATTNVAALTILIWLKAPPNTTSGTFQTEWGNNVPANRVSSSNVNLSDTVGNYFQITGVQLEVGDTATPFEHRSYSDQLQRCQRYYYNNFNNQSSSTVRAGNGVDNRVSICTRFNNGELQTAPICFPTTMRTSGSVSYYRPSHISNLNRWAVYGPTAGWSAGLIVGGQNVSIDSLVVSMTGAAGVSDFQSFIVSGYFEVDAEL